MDGLLPLSIVEGLEDSFDEQGRKDTPSFPPQRRTVEIEVFEDD